MIQVGDTIPTATLKWMQTSDDKGSACQIPQQVETTSFFAGKNAIIVAVPGAFTPTCSNTHVPGFLSKLSDLAGKNVDLIAVLSTNDVFVQSAWGKSLGVQENSTPKVVMVADGNGEFVTKLGLNQDLTHVGFGSVRSKRFAMIVKDNKVVYVGVDAKGVAESGVDAVLSKL